MPHSALNLFLGNNYELRAKRIRSLEESLNIQALDRHQLSAKSSSPTELISLARQSTALSSVRLIIIDDAQKLNAATLNVFFEHEAIIKKNACIIFVSDQLPQRHPLLKSSSKINIERFDQKDAPKPEPFALANALGARRHVSALHALNAQSREGKDPQQVLSMIIWQLERWILVRRLMDEGLASSRIVQESNLSDWQLKRVKDEVKNRSIKDLNQALKHAWKLDVDTKTGRTLPWVGLEVLVSEICRN